MEAAGYRFLALSFVILLKGTKTQAARPTEIDTPIALTQLSNIAFGST